VVLPGDDIDAQLDLAERAFGAKGAAERDRWRETVAGLIAQRRCLGAFIGDRLVGGAMFLDMRQWWCGQAVPMAGVSSVRVAPENRGQGIGRLLMTALLDEITAHRYPLSVLYPATMPALAAPAQLRLARPAVLARPTEPAPLALGPRGLAALYAGTPVAALRQAGLASGGSPEDDAALAAAFAAAPYMLDNL